MRLRTLRTFNWCQHRGEFVVEFSQGSTAFIGPNGSGKSNAFGAVRWLLTGDNPNDGDKSENICEEADPTEKAWGELSFAHGGAEYVIKKWLRPEKEKSTLTIDGEVKARGEREVVAMMAARLNMDAAAMKRFVLVEQGDIFGVLAESPETRAKTYQKLFDTGIVDELVAAITAHDNTVHVDDLRPQMPLLEQELAVAQEQLVGVRLKLAGADNPQAIEQAIAADRKIVDDYANRQSLEQTQQQLTNEVSEAEGTIQKIDVDLAQYNADLAVLDSAAAGNASATDNARATLVNLQSYRQTQLLREQLERNLQVVTTSQAALKQPERTGAVVDIDKAAAELTTLNNEIRRDQLFIQQFLNTGIAACPTCGTESSQLKARAEELQATLPQRGERAAALNSAITAERSYQSAMLVWESNSRQLDSQHQQTKAKLEGLATATPVQATEEELAKVINTQAEYVQGAATLREVINKENGRLARLNGDLSHKRQRLLDTGTKLALITVTAADAAAATTRLQTAGQKLSQLLELNRQEAALTTTVATCERGIRGLQDAIVVMDKRRAWLQDGEEVKSVLKMLPKLIAQSNLRQLESTINELLSLCNAPYRVNADETLSFVATFPSGRKQRAKRLSGGQRVLLALLFRIVVNIRFAAGIDFIALDEPTAYLDKKSIAAFKPLFERLRELMAQRGLQCLMITHEDELAPLFDTVVSLEIR